MFQLFTENEIYLNMTKYTIAFCEVYKNFGISFDNKYPRLKGETSYYVNEKLPVKQLFN
jgi:hypothetical protein